MRLPKGSEGFEKDKERVSVFLLWLLGTHSRYETT